MLKNDSLVTDQYSEISNPHPVYSERRAQCPIYQENGVWFLTRYDDVKLLLADPRFNRHPPPGHGFVQHTMHQSVIDQIIDRWIFFSDPPHHTRLREWMSTIFNPRAIKNTKNILDTISASLLAALIQQRTVDFMQVFAYPYPVQVINQLLGSSIDKDTLRAWSLTLVQTMERGNAEDFQASDKTAAAMRDYFYNLALERELNPQDDWISQLMQTKDQYQFTIDDVVANSIFILIAGHETLQLSLGLGLKAFLNNPDQIKLLQENNELMPSAIEEILRYEAALNKLSRWTAEDVQIDDTLIPKNQLVVGLVNAANRDPLRFAKPDQFDITRTNNRHFTFGHSIHSCLGALLARMELQAAFTFLLPHLHKMSLVEEELGWLPNTSFRYLFKLIIKIDET